ncbi:MAG: AAA family ATPase [Hormoscilla sp. GM102CHS1]|nr:AAA family ATPase [Hormoscilla sp. GM102CHS1]
MFTSVSVKNFRCFQDFSIDSLDRINLIAGKNNVGKTALLEAIFLLTGGTNPGIVVTLAAGRGVERFNSSAATELLFAPLFSNFDDRNPIKIGGLQINGDRHTVELQSVPRKSTWLVVGEAMNYELENSNHIGQGLQLKYTSPSGKIWLSNIWQDAQGIKAEQLSKKTPLLTASFIAAHAGQASAAAQLSCLEVVKEEYNIVESLRIVEPRLQRLTTGLVAGMPVIYGDLGLERLLPLSIMGEGLQRLTYILLAIAKVRNGIVLIDEVENGLHHSFIEKVWHAIGNTARKFDSQVIATTHNYECIQAAHQAFTESQKYDFRLHRLDIIDDNIRAVNYKQEILETAIATGFEVR